MRGAVFDAPWVRTRGRRFNLRLGCWLAFSYACISCVLAQESREKPPITHAIEVDQGVTLNVVEYRPAARHPPASSEAPQPLVSVMGLTAIPLALHVSA